MMDRFEILFGLERRPFYQGCLALWFNRFCREFGTFVAADIQEVPDAAMLDQVAVVVIGVGDPSGDADWMQKQISGLRASDAALPIVLLADDAHHEKIAEVAMQFRLQGHIPTSTNVEVAAAIVRLILAGGSYFPQADPHLGMTSPPGSRKFKEGVNVSAVSEKLTPRETAVLELLGKGNPNKIIAYRMGISLSTTKVHVHNIIKKLNARNRTEVALVVPRQGHKAPSHAAKEKRECANQPTFEFLAAINHEMRTPLNDVMGFSEVLAEEMLGPLGNPRYVEYATNILESARHLLSVINDIFDLSNAEAAKIETREKEAPMFASNWHRKAVFHTAKGASGAVTSTHLQPGTQSPEISVRTK